MESPLHKRILDNLSTATLLLDDDFRFVYLNPSAEMLIGISAWRLQGVHLNEVITCDGSGLQERLYEYLLAGRPYTERELKVTLPGPKEITVSCAVTPMIDADGALAALMEFMELDWQLRIIREERRLSEQVAARAVVRGLAHEIKNPLGGLRGAAQLLEGELTDQNLKEYTRIIIGEADRLHKLVDRMLGPKDPPKKTAVDIHDVLEHVRNLVLAEAPARVCLQRDYDPSIPKLLGDRDLLIQAVLNVVRNALQAVGARGTIMLKTRIQHRFTIGQVRHRLVARADIIDDGPGIPEALREKLFLPMVTGREGGTGLGLSIAQTLINQHGGLLECDSKPGYTRFSVLLPIETRPSE